MIIRVLFDGVEFEEKVDFGARVLDQQKSPGRFQKN